MKVKTKEVRELTGMLDEIIERYTKDHPKKKRDWRTYEQRFAYRLRIAYKELQPLVKEACSSLQIVKGESRGAEPKLTLEQKVLLLLLKHIVQKSNRDISGMLTMFSWLSNVEVSYKTVERLYSDHTVLCALHNLHSLLLKKKGIEKANCGEMGQAMH
jgi:hypothetical protein